MNYAGHAGAKQAVALLEVSAEEHQQLEGSCNRPQPHLCQEEPPPCSLGSAFAFAVTISQAIDLFISYSRVVYVKMNVKRKYDLAKNCPQVQYV